MTSATDPVRLPPELTFDPMPIRERFIARATNDHEDRTKWPRTKVEIFDTKHSTTDPIYTYGRNYDFLRTFEPFRLFVDNTWRNYAAISPDYTTFQILDLDNREVIVERDYPKMPFDIASRYNEQLIKDGKEPAYSAGDPWPSAGFCPQEFHVPDILDIYDDGSLRIIDTVENYTPEQAWRELDLAQECVTDFLSKRTFGLLAGCVWGDDWSMKIETFDLTGIPEGKLGPSPDLGYVVMPDNLRLKDVYDETYYIYEDMNRFVLHLPVAFHIGEDRITVRKSSFYGSEPNGFEDNQN